MELIKKYREMPFHKKLDRFALSPLAFSILFLLACLIVVFDFQINGVAIFGYIIICMLILCSDLLAICLPLLLCTVFATALYDSAEKFMSFIIPEAVIAVLSLIFHFVVYEKKFSIGKSFWGLIGVCVAVTFSGIGSLSPSQYFAPSSLYYIFFLGLGLLLIYLVIRSYYKESSDYDIYQKFAVIMYVMGLFAAYNVGFYYIDSFSEFIKNPGIISFQAANNLSTFLLFALPFPFYFALKGSKLHLLSALLMFSCLIASGSGGGLLMGCALMGLCLIFMAIYDKKLRALWIVIISLCIIGGAFLFGYLIKAYNFASFEDIFYSNNFRMALFRRSLFDFSDHPIFGAGLTHRGNTDIYNPKEGAMTWYHMMLPQIWGSMGTIGILGYLFNFFIRAKLAWKNRRDVYSATLVLSYLGLFLMSQVNPGEFCPIPYALLAVLLFIFIEKRAESQLSLKHKNKDKTEV